MKKIDFFSIVKDLCNLHESKMYDYSDGDDPYSNFVAAANSIGIKPHHYVTARIAEKLHRLESLITQSKNPKHESISDAYQDIACMSIIAIELLEREA